MTRKSIKITEQVYDYLLSVSLTESAILKECREYTGKHPMARMQIAPEQGQFFQFLIESLQVKRAIEIGVFTGYSSLAIAMALPEGGQLIACDQDPEVTSIASKFWENAGVSEKIELRIAPALETLGQARRGGQFSCELHLNLLSQFAYWLFSIEGKDGPRTPQSPLPIAALPPRFRPRRAKSSAATMNSLGR